MNSISENISLENVLNGSAVIAGTFFLVRGYLRKNNLWGYKNDINTKKDLFISGSMVTYLAIKIGILYAKRMFFSAHQTEQGQVPCFPEDNEVGWVKVVGVSVFTISGALIVHKIVKFLKGWDWIPSC